MIGQIHQTNQAWEDAIKAYRRVIDEYKDGQWVQEAKWSIAECKINLSQWQEAMAAYRDYVSAYPQDPKLAEANRRLEILKDLARFQELVNEKGQRKAFDAQFQIATIVRTQLANPVKGIIEYRKVATNWPESYVAATALHEIGNSYVDLGETAKAREAYMAVAKDYPTSPLAGASLFQVGKSYEDEADKLATVTRERTVEVAKEQAQSKAYQQVQSSRRSNEAAQSERILSLKKFRPREAGRSGRGQGGLQPATASTWPTRPSLPSRRRPRWRRSRPPSWPTARTRSTPPCGRRSRPTRRRPRSPAATRPTPPCCKWPTSTTSA